MKSTTIPVKEDLKMRLNHLKYQWGYKTLDHTIRHLLEIKTPPLTNTKSHQNFGTPSFFNSSSNSEGGADNNPKEKREE